MPRKTIKDQVNAGTTADPMAMMPSGGKPHILAALRSLGDQMRKLEQQRQQRSGGSGNGAEADRDAAQMALTAVASFFLDHGIEAEPIFRILRELAALSEGSSPSLMLSAAPRLHRRPDSPVLQLIKGKLAAIMEYRQTQGMTRKQAAQWVVRHMPAKLAAQVGSVTSSAVDSWLTKWGGNRGANPGCGREGYLSLRRILARLRPSEADLKRVFAGLER